jgi:hypothetical protein
MVLITTTVAPARSVPAAPSAPNRAAPMGTPPSAYPFLASSTATASIAAAARSMPSSSTPSTRRRTACGKTSVVALETARKKSPAIERRLEIRTIRPLSSMRQRRR